MKDTESFIKSIYVTNSNMAELIHQQRISKNAEEICEKKSLNISLLKRIFKEKMRGYNNTHISENLGVHRVTIQRYMDLLRKMTESEFNVIYENMTGIKNE